MAHAYAHLYAPALHRPALLHRLRPLGPARHGADALRQGDPRRPADPALQRTAGTAATSPTSTTSSRGWSAPPTASPTPDPAWDPAAPDPATSDAPFRIYNIGNSAPVELADFIAALERALGRTAISELLPLQPGDVPDTWADSTRLAARGRLAPRHPGRRGRAPLRRLVPGLLRLPPDG